MEVKAYTHYSLSTWDNKSRKCICNLQSDNWDAPGVWLYPSCVTSKWRYCVSYDITFSVENIKMQFLCLQSPNLISSLQQWMHHSPSGPSAVGRMTRKLHHWERVSTPVWIWAKNRRRKRFQTMFHNLQSHCGCWTKRCQFHVYRIPHPLPKDVLSALCSSANGWVRQCVERNRLKVSSGANSVWQEGDLIMWGLIRPSSWLISR